MSEERLDELREILHNPNLKGYLPNVCNELLQELRKKENKIEELMELYTTERHCKDDYKNIIKEVREKVNKYPEFNYSNDYMIFRNEIKKILDKENI